MALQPKLVNYYKKRLDKPEQKAYNKDKIKERKSKENGIYVLYRFSVIKSNCRRAHFSIVKC